MEKLLVLNNNETLQEFPLEQRRVELGRDPTNDLCLGDQSVSRHHASLVRIYTEYYLEDHRSTNGTRLNGQDIKKHMLKNGDVIEIGKYRLKYKKQQEKSNESDLDRTVVIQPSVLKRVSRAKTANNPPTSKPGLAFIHYLAGPEKGQEAKLNRAFFTIGETGGDLALITKRHQGYYLLKLGGHTIPSVNGNSVRAGGVELTHGDQIVFGERQLEFLSGS
ncbi:MAG: FHA domain-containing protein [gamma proteobacterium endosymbiont of Lamellibrachia anaximandri]|nr:FHA domain-containing protein [gamma proteobacterium endosymbiont of Lamellibrachia anaximandri]